MTPPPAQATDAPSLAPQAALARRRVAVHARLTSLDSEIETWSNFRKKPELAIHASQIEDVCGGLRAMHALLLDELEAAEKSGTLTHETAGRLERRILAALLIWESYRSKFALRLVEPLRGSLALMDELAWEAYRPVRDRVVASGARTLQDVREPPLVFPNPRWSPFARSREQAYELDEQTGDLNALAGFDEWLRAIPVPLVGVPWYHLAHLPDAVFIGHEVGHLAEEDFGLEEELRAAIGAALDGAPPERRTAWTRHWRSEVFADVYGVLTTGSAYAAALLDVLTADAAVIEGERQPDLTRMQQWSAYPTRALRAQVVCEAVRQLPGGTATSGEGGSFIDFSAALSEAWTAVHPRHAMELYEEDVARVVAAILTTPLAPLAAAPGGAGMPLTSVLTFSTAMEKNARDDAMRARGRTAPSASDTRTLFAGVAHAFLGDQERYRASGAQNRFRRQLEDKRSKQPRGEVLNRLDATSRAARHQAVGAALLGRLGG